MILQAVFCVVLYAAATVEGHGRLVVPPARSTMWRPEYGRYPTPHNTQDMQLNCGGEWQLWGVDRGRCGICGDPINAPHENEAGGKYANGIIVGHYREGQTINVTIELTQNHGGWHEFRICPNNDVHRPATEACLDKHLLGDSSGLTRHYIPERPLQPSAKFTIWLVLPRGLTCSQCVLQWKWKTAQNWGCENGHCGKGLGNQEQFYGCADVSISRAGGDIVGATSGSGTGRDTTASSSVTNRETSKSGTNENRDTATSTAGTNRKTTRRPHQEFHGLFDG